MGFTLTVGARVVLPAHNEDSKNSPRESVTHNDGTKTRILHCDWANVGDMVQYLLGRTFTTPTGMQLIPPHYYPNTPWNEHYVVDAVEVEGMGYQANAVAPTVSSYQKAKLTVTYRPCLITAPGAIDWLAYIMSEEFLPAAEFRTLARRKLYWDNAQAEPLSDDEAPGVIDYSAEWSITMIRLPRLPTNILAAVGTCNSAAVTSHRYGLTFAAGTLLYSPPEIEPGFNTWGTNEWTVRLKLLYRASTWNKFPPAGSATPVSIYNSAGSVFYQYPLTYDFNDIIIST